jgi:hypothetical protein
LKPVSGFQSRHSQRLSIFFEVAEVVAEVVGQAGQALADYCLSPHHYIDIYKI